MSVAEVLEVSLQFLRLRCFVPVSLAAAREKAHGGQTVPMRRVLLLHRRPQLAQKTQNATLRGATLQMPLLSLHLHPVDDLQSAPEDEARRGGYVQHPVPVRGVRVQDCEGEHLPDPRGRPQRGARQRQGGKGTKRA